MIRKATLANVLAKVVGERPSLERGIGRSPSYSQRPLMSCSEAEALMRRGSTDQAAEPRFPAPISGKDIRTVAKVGRNERL
jgi:hypothetical protein